MPTAVIIDLITILVTSAQDNYLSRADPVGVVFGYSVENGGHFVRDGDAGLLEGFAAFSGGVTGGFKGGIATD